MCYYYHILGPAWPPLVTAARIPLPLGTLWAHVDTVMECFK